MPGAIRLVIGIGMEKVYVDTEETTTLAKVLADVVQERGLGDPEEYTLQWEMKPKAKLDLTRPLSLTGINANSLLWLKRTKKEMNRDASVPVALQTNDGRFSHVFARSYSLWSVLEYFEQQHNTPTVSAVDGMDKYRVPVVFIHRVKYASVGVLKQTTLGSLRTGKSGIVMMLHFETSSISLQEAQAMIQKFDAEVMPVLQQQQAEMSVAPSASIPFIDEPSFCNSISDPEMKDTDIETNTTTFGSTEREIYELLDEMDHKMVDSRLQEKTLRVLHTIVQNLVQSDDAKFRSLQLENAVLARYVYNFHHGRQFLLSLGFKEEQCFSLNPEQEDRDQLLKARTSLSKAASIVKQKTLPTTLLQKDESKDEEPLQQGIVVYQAVHGTAKMPSKSIEYTEDDVSQSDLILLREAAAQTRAKNKYADFLTPQSFVEQKSQHKAYDRSRIRYRFGDHILAEAEFRPTATLHELYDKLREILKPDTHDIRLIVPPSFSLQDSTASTLFDHGLVPLASVFVRSAAHQPLRM